LFFFGEKHKKRREDETKKTDVQSRKEFLRKKQNTATAQRYLTNSIKFLLQNVGDLNAIVFQFY